MSGKKDSSCDVLGVYTTVAAVVRAEITPHVVLGVHLLISGGVLGSRSLYAVVMDERTPHVGGGMF